MTLKYIPCGRASCGWRPVRMLDNSGYTYLHDDGHLMAHRFKEVSPFDNKMAIVRLFDADEECDLTYVRDDETIVPMLFEDVYPFLEGQTQAPAYYKGERYMVNQDCWVYRLKSNFLQSLKPADENARGILFKLRSGKRLELLYHPIGPVSEGMFPVEMKDGSGQTFVRRKDFQIMESRFKEVTCFLKVPGTKLVLALVKDFEGETLYIDRDEVCYDKESVYEMLDNVIKNHLTLRLQEAKKVGRLDIVIDSILREYGLPENYLDGIADRDNIEDVVDALVEMYNDEDNDDENEM